MMQASELFKTGARFRARFSIDARASTSAAIDRAATAIAPRAS